MKNKQDYIAVFDSGIGGVSVLKRLMALMPRERYLYFGDSANAPYGDRPEAEILSLTLSAAESILQQNVKALVVACNTATAVAVEALRSRYRETVIVGIEPAVKPAAENFPGGTVGILGTTATLHSRRFHQLLDRRGAGCRFLRLSVPGLVPLVEQGLGNSPEAASLLEPILLPHRETLDAVVLGCTHYPFAAESIRRCLKPGTPLLDGGIGTAKQTHRLLAEANLLNDGQGALVYQNSSPDPSLHTLFQTLLTQTL